MANPFLQFCLGHCLPIHSLSLYHPSFQSSPCTSFLSLHIHMHSLSQFSLVRLPPPFIALMPPKFPNFRLPTPRAPIRHLCHLPLLPSSLLCFVSIVL